MVAYKRLSILIISILERFNTLSRLLEILSPQLNNQVELLVLIDNKGLSIGQKRNMLLQKAQGDYVCFIDDDDEVAPTYIELIMKALKANPDCVGFNGQIIAKNGTRKVEYSLRNRNSLGYRDQVYHCGCGHLQPIRRDIAQAAGFAEISHGEDSDFWNRVKDKLQKEVFIDSVLYNYHTRACVQV